MSSRDPKFLSRLVKHLLRLTQKLIQCTSKGSSSLIEIQTLQEKINTLIRKAQAVKGNFQEITHRIEVLVVNMPSIP